MNYIMFLIKITMTSYFLQNSFKKEALIFACLFSLLVLDALVVLLLIAEGKVFNKAGFKSRAAFTPVNNIRTLFRCSGAKHYKLCSVVYVVCEFVLLFIAAIIVPILCFFAGWARADVSPINTERLDLLFFWLPLIILVLPIIVVSTICCIKLSKKFGHSPAFGLGLAFLPYIFFPILGFGKSVYFGEFNMPVNSGYMAQSRPVSPNGQGYIYPNGPVRNEEYYNRRP